MLLDLDKSDYRTARLYDAFFGKYKTEAQYSKVRNNRRAGKPAGRKPDKTGLLGLFTKGKDIPTTAQQTLPYREMYRDGVCRVADCYYTKTIEYEDINYQLAQSEDQAAIFDVWSACLNYFCLLYTSRCV